MKIELKGIKKTYNGRIVLNIDSLVFKEGKVYAVIGPNGSGKSTMLKIMAGIEKADSGQVFVQNGEGVESHISYLPQKPYIFDFTVLENVMMGMKKSEHAAGKAREALDRVGMGDFINSRANSLSGGEAQRTALARTLVLERKFVLLDEPASAADISSVRMVENCIKLASSRDGSTIVFTTHNPSQAYRIADEVIVLWAGEVIEKGGSQRVLKSPEMKETKEFLENWRL